MKWFFCWCQDTDFRDDHNWKDLIRVSVESAQKNTTLEPHFIYDGEESDFIEELRMRGVEVHFHKVSFLKNIVEHQPNNQQFQAIARGAFLRFDIPFFVEPSDQFALYTDADVAFQREPDLSGYCPDFLAAAPQMERGRRLDMNSGVMLLNMEAFARGYGQLVDFTIKNLNLGLDQEVLRVFLGERYLLLPDEYNWKPYWGLNQEAPIIHWHGPKPETVSRLLDGRSQTPHESWRILFERDRHAYARYCDDHAELLKGYWARQAMLANAQKGQSGIFFVLDADPALIEAALGREEKVVAVQPDVRLYYALAERFAAPIAQGRLVLENFAPAPRGGEIAMLQPGDGGRPYPVATISWDELVARHGRPASVRMGAQVPGFPAMAQ